MRKLNYFELIGPGPVCLEGIGNLRFPTIEDIYRIGQNKYRIYLSVLSLTSKEAFDMVNLGSIYKQIKRNENNRLEVLSYMSSLRIYEQIFTEIFSFYFADEVTYDKKTQTYLIGGKGRINDENYEEIAGIILQINHIKTKSAKQTLSGQKAKEISEKIEKAKKKNKDKGEGEWSFPISSHPLPCITIRLICSIYGR